MSAILESGLTATQRAECEAADAAERMNTTLRLIRRSPARLVDLLALVTAVASRIEEVARATDSLGNLWPAVDSLSDAEHALENVEPFDSASAQKWADVPRRRTV